MIDTDEVGQAMLKLLDRLEREYAESRIVRVAVVVQVINGDDDELVWESNCDWVGEAHLGDWLADAAEPDGDDDD